MFRWCKPAGTSRSARVESAGRRNALGRNVGMAGRRRSDRAWRSKLRSPGRPPVARQAHRCCFWALVAGGLSSKDAATGPGVSTPLGARWFRNGGGMAPSTLASSATPLSGKYLSFAEREELAIQRAQGVGVREIARQMGRSGSTISRELRCNAATRGGGLDYRATTAQWHAERAARRPSLPSWPSTRRCGPMCRIGWRAWSWQQAVLRFPDRRCSGKAADTDVGRIGDGLRLGVLNRLPIDSGSTFRTMRISHEAIYQSLYVQGRGALRRELTACLRTGRALRVPRARSRGRGKSFLVPEIMISERPVEVADQAVPGQREGNLILGLDSSAIGTLVERTTRFTMLLHLPRMAQYGLGARVKNGPALAGHGV